MFDHFLNMFKLGKLNRNRSQARKPKNRLFGKKKFLDFPANQFFFSKNFPEKISGA
jgi:hypothetical protein